MKQEEEDNAFLSSLGVTSANPEDIERDVLQQVLIRSISKIFLFLPKVNVYVFVESTFCFGGLIL